MGSNDISFPNLGIHLRNVPKTFSVFGIEIALYGLIIACGMAAGLALCLRLAKKSGQDPDTYWSFFFYAILFSLLGARLYYVFFSWDYYRVHLTEIFNLRNGGLAIYGGVIAGFLTLYVFTRVKKISFFQMADTGVCGLALGQAIGRWGNFTNREAFGGYTEGLFAMRIPAEAVRGHEITEDIAAHMLPGNIIQVHPTFLYECLWNLCLLLLLLIFTRYRKFKGEICLLYLGGYGIGRFWIESLRTDQLLIPGTGLAVSQLLGLLLFLFAIAADLKVRRGKRKKV